MYYVLLNYITHTVSKRAFYLLEVMCKIYEIDFTFIIEIVYRAQ